MKKSIVKTFLVILLLVVSNVLTLFIASSGDVDPQIVQEITSQVIPIVLGVLTAMSTMLLKSKSMELIVTNMVNNGKAIFDRSASNVEEVKKEARNTSKLVGEQNARIENLVHKVEEAISIKNTVEILNQKLDIFFLNNPDAVRSGLTKQIYGVDHHEE